jgi:glucose-1-phosphate thymidylyltransferase
MGRGIAWLDTGTFDSLLASAQFVQILEERQGLKIACLEEIALLKGFITLDEFSQLVTRAGDNSYGRYLKRILTEKESGSRL